jgi:type I restriction enzyme, S subunit
MNKLRFSTFDDSLTESTLSMHLKQKSIRNKDLDVSEVLSVSNQFGFISQKDQFNDREIASKDQTNYKLVLKDEYAYNPARINVGSIARLKDYNVGIISPMYVVFEVKKSLSKKYFDYFIKSKSFSDQMKTRLVGSVRQTLDFKSISSIKINLPSIKEQEKIGGFLSAFDKLIEKQQEKIGLLKELKKGYLQKMFPKNDSNVPEIRFKGFTDTWEQCELSELANFGKGSGYSKGDLIDSGSPIILYGRLYTKYETTISDVDTFVVQKSGSVISKGGEVIVPASGETAEDIAIASVVEKPGILLGGDLNVIYPNEKIDPTFLAISITYGKPHIDMATRAQGKSVVHLHNSDLRKVMLDFPKREEQLRISQYIKSIDNLITLNQRKLDQLENLKKGYMQRLFA